MRISKLILCGLLLGAFCAGVPARENNQQPAAWSTDVIGINEMHLSASYWVKQTKNADQVIKSPREIAEFKKEIFSTDQHMVDLALYPQKLSGLSVREKILSISKPNKSPLYSPEGETLSAEGYQQYTANLGLENIPEFVEAHFALAVNRSDMRTYPTDDRFYKKKKNQNLDRFQENGLFPGDALAVLHVSADKNWAFVQSYNYAAWVRLENIAIGDRKEIQQYKNPSHFLVVTGDKVWTSFNPEIPALSELQLDMGIRVPLADPGDISNNLYGQNPYTSHTVLLPLRDPEGTLEFKQALIARNQDVNHGFIPLTKDPGLVCRN